MKKKKKSKKKVEFEDEVEQASETATPHNEINEGNLECRIALFIAGDGSFTNLITWQIEAADEEDPEQMFADLKMKKKKKKVKTEVIDSNALDPNQTMNESMMLNVFCIIF